jgi:hypothetical protein
LALPENLVVFLRWNVFPGEPGDDRAVREFLLALPVSLDRDIVPQHRSEVVEIAFFVGDRDQPPVAIPGRHLDAKDRISLIIRAPGDKRRCYKACRKRRGRDHD